MNPLFSTALSAWIGLGASFTLGWLAQIAAQRTGVPLPLAPVLIGGAAGGILGHWLARLADRSTASSTRAFLRIFFILGGASVLTGVLGIVWFRELLFPGVPVRYSGVGLLGWSVGLFAGGGWIAVQALIRQDPPGDGRP